MGKLDNKIALITGGSEGIGLATAQRFIAEGAEHVFITGRRQQALEQAVKKIGKINITAVQSDASNMNDLDKLFDIIKKEKGRLDIIFANAGTCLVAPLGTITEKHFDDTFNVNSWSDDTPLLRSLGKDEEETKTLMAEWQAAAPLNRIGTPDEVAKVVVFLASNDSSFITGVELFVDGGLSQI
ncbi:unnamed protein product [Adineta steineri]|uniref:Uncharacterized protein n=1 Tax=Adineta steineri TaxID=433720 RepID=A0A815F1G2_9BILA|nr:unnamed protein product [Adineta steineri]CAF1583321.1 unnamed protein product [Adineta steineri]